ncbi:hypothetical protein, partial [Paraburkholderia sp. J11-2]|uniref:hypothetical protein n=1 Tax=Paraburkholderia sp. J11-2 TaxID=2805431 RepID=UPI002AB75DD2
MNKTNNHQYYYWISRGAGMCAVGAGVLFTAVTARAAGDTINPVILLADAPMPASGAEGFGAFSAPVAEESPAAGSPAAGTLSKTDSDSDSTILASDVSTVFAPNDCISRTTGSACFRGNGGGHGGSGSSSGSNGSSGGGAGAATASTGGLGRSGSSGVGGTGPSGSGGGSSNSGGGKGGGGNNGGGNNGGGNNGGGNNGGGNNGGGNNGGGNNGGA